MLYSLHELIVHCHKILTPVWYKEVCWGFTEAEFSFNLQLCPDGWVSEISAPCWFNILRVMLSLIDLVILMLPVRSRSVDTEDTREVWRVMSVNSWWPRCRGRHGGGVWEVLGETFFQVELHVCWILDIQNSIPICPTNQAAWVSSCHTDAYQLVSVLLLRRVRHLS